MFDRFKRYHVCLNGLALLVIAVGMIAAPMFENSILVMCLAAFGTVEKECNDSKKIHSRWICVDLLT